MKSTSIAICVACLWGTAATALADPTPLINITFNDFAGNQSLENQGSAAVTGTMTGSTIGFSSDVPPVNSGGWSGDFNGPGSTGDFGDDAIDFGDISDLDGLTALTITAWVKGIEFHPNGSRLVAKENNPNGIDFSIPRGSGDTTPTTGGYPALAVGGANQSSFVELASGGTRIPVNEWGFVAASFDSTVATDNLTWFIGDGTTLNFASEDFAAGAVNPSSQPLLIGNFRFTGRAFQGLIDDVRIYGEALSPNQVQAVMTFDDLIPEPSSLLLLLVSGLLFVARRARFRWQG